MPTPPSPPRILLAAAALMMAGALPATAQPSGGAAEPTTTAQAPAAPQPPAVVDPAAGLFANFLAGRVALTLGDTSQAADFLTTALRGDPDNLELLNRAFMAALLDGRPEALRIARRIPENGVALLVLMGSEAVAGRWDRAEIRVRALPRGGLTQALAPLLQAWTLAGRNQTDAALALLRPVIEHGRFRSLAALHGALIADLANRNREAERLLRISLSDQTEPTLRLAMLAAAILSRSGKPGEATRILDQVAANGDEISLAAAEPARRAILGQRGVASAVEGIAEAYVAMAGALRGQAADDQAMAMARLALRLRPNFAPAILLLSDILTDSDQNARALELLGGIRPEDALAPVALLRRAGLLDKLDRPAEAEALLREQAAALPTRPQSLVRLGDMFRRRSRFAEAAAAYDEAMARVPNPREQEWPLFYARGISRERSGNWPGAEADFLRALELSPEQPYVLNYLGYSWADQGINLDRALPMLRRAVELRPQDGNIADSLGWVLFRLGDKDGAIEWLERAVELEPRNGTINYHLGDAYWVAGRRSEAEFQWSRALTMELETGEEPAIRERLSGGLPERAWPAGLRP
ncbi:tetratricopeptide repeat protein [Rhodovarius crocodyli]|uniref:Tetratricopeptide repeat protein n=1 Tax=Rhodovarius crocodyli TaxID=1979269 RepID=A0A437MCV8_9PROT|nr:tetratricopeptide repeat protein [Rhodovarius crocodyli]RVT95465.1 tetratricopeptide repeat protein [Rhodovarius crocodyli]